MANTCRFSAEDLAEVAADRQLPPFNVVCTSHASQMRRYPWGDCEINNRQHSDFPLLKCLLLGHKVRC